MRSAWQYLSQYLGASEYKALNPEESAHSKEEELKEKLREVEIVLSRIPNTMLTFFNRELEDLEKGKIKIQSQAEKVLETLANDILDKKPPTPLPKQAPLPAHKPLYEAIRNHKIEVVKSILETGINLYQEDDEGRSPLYIAAIYNYEKIVELLLNKGAVVNQSNKDGKTPLVVSLISTVVNSKVSVLELLLKRGADVKALDQAGETPLHYAVRIGNLESMKWLLDKGSDPNVADKEGATPLHYAAVRRNPESMKLLLDKGANPNIVNIEGKMPLQVVLSLFPPSSSRGSFFSYERKQYIEAIKILIGHGAKVSTYDIECIKHIEDESLKDLLITAQKEQGIILESTKERCDPAKSQKEVEIKHTAAAPSYLGRPLQLPSAENTTKEDNNFEDKQLALVATSGQQANLHKHFELSDKVKEVMLALEEEIIKTIIRKFIIIYHCEAESVSLRGAYVKLAEIIGQGVEFPNEADKLVEWIEHFENKSDKRPLLSSFAQGMGKSLRISNEYAKKGNSVFGPDILPKFELKGDLADILLHCSKLNPNNSAAEKVVTWLLESLNNYIEYEVKRIGILQKPEQGIEAAIKELTPQILDKGLPFDFTAIIEKAIADEDLGPPFNAASHTEVVPMYSSTSAAAAAAMPAYPSSPPQKIPTMALDRNDDSVPSSDGRSPQSVEEDFMPFSPPITYDTQFQLDQ
jgi:ankyrin repeat protein